MTLENKVEGEKSGMKENYARIAASDYGCFSLVLGATSGLGLLGSAAAYYKNPNDIGALMIAGIIVVPAAIVSYFFRGVSQAHSDTAELHRREGIE